MIKRVLIHRLFRISIFIKGIFAFMELISGILLFFVTQNSLLNFVRNVFGHELAHDPTDILVNLLLNLFSNFSNSMKLFFAIYLLIHGIIKFGLIIGLWDERLWVYPVSIVVFSLFIIYQLYRYTHHPSLFLILLTELDIAVIILTYLEYRNLKTFVKK